MSSFTSPLETLTLTKDLAKRLHVKESKRGRYKVIIKPFRYWLDDLHDDGPFITVPYFFLSDGASIPRLLWTLVGSPWSGDYVQAAVVHDYLFRNCGWVVHRCKRLSSKYECSDILKLDNNTHIVKYTHDACNKILHDASDVLGTKSWRSAVMYVGLYWGGLPTWHNWHKHWIKRNKHPLYIANQPEFKNIIGIKGLK